MDKWGIQKGVIIIMGMISQRQKDWSLRVKRLHPPSPSLFLTFSFFPFSLNLLIMYAMNSLTWFGATYNTIVVIYLKLDCILWFLLWGVNSDNNGRVDTHASLQ